MSIKIIQKIFAGLISFVLFILSGSYSFASQVEYIYDNLNRLVEVREIGVVCSYSISPSYERFNAVGGSSLVDVTALSGCSWMATSNAAWVTITSGGSGSGNGRVFYSVAPNDQTGYRTGTIAIADKTFRVNQNGGDRTPPTTTASPPGGTLPFPQSVTLSCNDGPGIGCDKIYYTTDGSTPTTSSTVYSSPISISTDTTLKYFAKDLAGNAEAVKTEIYTIP